MIVMPKRLRLLAIPGVLEHNICPSSTFGSLIGCNKHIAFGIPDLSIQNRRLHQTVFSRSLGKSTMSMTRIGSIISAETFSTTTCNRYKEITDEKKLRAAKIKKLHRDNKELFGELLESSSKAKRLKKESTKKKVIITDGHTHDGELERSGSPVRTAKKLATPKSKSKERKALPSPIHKSSKGNVDGVESIWRMEPVGLERLTDDKNQPFTDHNSMGFEDKGQVVEPESIPSVNQLMASFCTEKVDKTVKTKKRIIKTINQETEFTLNSNTRKVSNAKLISTSKSSTLSSHATNDFSTEISLSEHDKQLTGEWPINSSTTDTTYPFDNPERILYEDENSSSNPLAIISIPFPRHSNSAIITSNSSATDSVPTVPHTRLPSVSKILNATMPKEQAEALEKWQQKMIEKLGEEGFRKYKQDILNNGTELHSNIYSLLSGKPADQLSISKSISGHWNSLQGILSQVERVHILESHVAHPHLNYCGIVDCIAVFRDKLMVIDWKTSQKPKPYVSMTYDTPLQIAAYIGALNYDPNYSIKVTEGLIAIAYENGHNSQVFHLNPFEVSRYWKMWLNRLHLYQNQVQLPTSLPFTTTTSQITS